MASESSRLTDLPADTGLRIERPYRGHLLNVTYLDTIEHCLGIGVIEAQTGNALYTQGNITSLMPPFFLAIRQFSKEELKDEFDYFEGARMRVGTKYNEDYGIVVVYDHTVSKEEVKDIAQYLHEECARSYHPQHCTEDKSQMENFHDIIEIEKLKDYKRLLQDEEPELALKPASRWKARFLR